MLLLKKWVNRLVKDARRISTRVASFVYGRTEGLRATKERSKLTEICSLLRSIETVTATFSKVCTRVDVVFDNHRAVRVHSYRFS